MFKTILLNLKQCLNNIRNEINMNSKSVFQYESTFENPREIMSSLQDKNIEIHVQDRNHCDKTD